VSGVDRGCPWLSAGPCPRHTPKWRLPKKRPKGCEARKSPFLARLVAKP
jgi:hypothetical protein